MSVHMVRVFAEPPLESVQDAVQAWLDAHDPWADCSAPKHVSPTTTPGGVEYVSGDFRLNKTLTRDELLGDLNARLVDRWHRLVYHECTHDEGSSNCEFTYSWTHGDVPDEIPDPA